MPGKRPVGPEDVSRGQRFAELRRTRWKSQAAMAKETGIDRLRVMRLESGEERFTGPDFQEEVAEAFGVPPSALLDYVRGRSTLEELLAVQGSQPQMPQVPHAPISPAPTTHEPSSDPYPNRVLFLKLHGDQISEATREFIRTIAFSSGDKELEEWRALAKAAERDRLAFGAEVTGKGIGDPGGWGTVPPKKKRAGRR